MYQIWLMIFALAGLTLSTYLWKKKSRKEKLVCVIGKDCSKVIDSKYGTMFGIDNILIGALYYIFIFAASLVSIFFPLIFPQGIFHLAILIISGMALLFSTYLSFIQVAVLKELCEYCLASALINLIIFFIFIF